MKYQCIKCRVTWGEGTPEVDGYSHGLCLNCLKEALTPLYRKRQMQEGNFDCFGRAEGSCDQYGCKYREICLVSILSIPGETEVQGNATISVFQENSLSNRIGYESAPERHLAVQDCEGLDRTGKSGVLPLTKAASRH